MHKAKIPPIKLTNNNMQIFNPTPTGSPFLTLFPKIIVIGRHHASGKINQPCAKLPYSLFDSTEQPHPVQIVRVYVII